MILLLMYCRARSNIDQYKQDKDVQLNKKETDLNQREAKISAQEACLTDLAKYKNVQNDIQNLLNKTSSVNQIKAENDAPGVVNIDKANNVFIDTADTLDLDTPIQ